jgi:hypothetical protein
MSFILVIVRHPDQQKSADMATWKSFRAHAKLDSLKEVAGVFCINDTAWIFDTKTTLPECGLVIHQASEFGSNYFPSNLSTKHGDLTWRLTHDQKGWMRFLLPSSSQ